MARLCIALALLVSAPVATAEVCGDCDSSGITDILDALQAAQFAAGTLSTVPSEAACDVDTDFRVTVLDGLMIAQNAAGLSVTLDCDLGPRTWERITTAASPPARVGASMAFDSARGVTVLFGGVDSAMTYPYISNYEYTQLFNDTWEYNGTDWSPVGGEEGPPGRFLAAMAYDEARAVMVLFGGTEASTWPAPTVGALTYNDTWENDGSGWIQRHPATSPAPKWGSSMVYDAARQEIVLWGGRSDQAPYDRNETWVWDGTDWALTGGTLQPPSGYPHPLTYDSSRDRVTLVGSSHCAPNNDTWEWDGTDWTLALPGGYYSPFPGTSTGTGLPTASPVPTAGYGNSGVFDSHSDETIVIGYSYTSTRMEMSTYAWDGVSWSLHFPGAPLPLRMGNSITYDSARRAVVVFGGTNLSWYGTVNSETWEY